MTTQIPDRVGESAADAASGVMDAARAEGRAVTDTARTEAQRLAEHARRELHDQSQAQMERLGTSVRVLAEQLHRLAAGDGPTEGPVADLVRQAGDRADALAQRIEARGIDGLTDDLKAIARRRPAMYLAGAFALGIVAGRLFRNLDTQALADAARPADEADGQPDPESVPTDR